MSDFHLIHVAQAGPVTAEVYFRHQADQDEYRVRFGTSQSQTTPLAEDQLAAARKVIEQADLFICFQRQRALLGRCPGCGDN